MSQSVSHMMENVRSTNPRRLNKRIRRGESRENRVGMVLEERGVAIESYDINKNGMDSWSKVLPTGMMK